jgi:hypothetical protein
MGEILGALVRGLVVLVGNLLSVVDVHELGSLRRRRARQAALARGERAEIPCVLQDPELTGGREQEGKLVLGDGPVKWVTGGQPSAVFSPGELTMQAVDRKAITFHSESRRTELRLHPDEAPPVLRALAS